MSDQDDIKDQTDDVDTDRVDDDPDDAEDKPLAPPGQKAFDALKAKRRRDIERREAAEARAKELEAELGKLKSGSDKKDDQPDPEEIRKQAKAEAQAEVLRDRALDKVETKAAKLFADPEDARALLASRVDEFVDDGKVDVEAIEEALTDLLSKKPHLAAATAKRFQGGADGGARKGSKPDQLTREDVKRLSREGKHKEIEKARQEGRLVDLLSGSK